MGRWKGSRPSSSLNSGKIKKGMQPDGQARILTPWLVPVPWACHAGRHAAVFLVLGLAVCVWVIVLEHAGVG